MEKSGIGRGGVAMTIVKVQGHKPNHAYATRNGTAHSDADGVIHGIHLDSQQLRDLLASGCSVILASTPAGIAKAAEAQSE
jgi:hypothetical protein